MIIAEEFVDKDTELDEVIGELEGILLTEEYIAENPTKIRKLVLILE
ncbi:MAG: hypothetical protein ACE5KE_00570 [Methanosarcinales archaeon]